MKALLILATLNFSQLCLASDFPCKVTSKRLDHRIEIANEEVPATSEASVVIEEHMSHLKPDVMMDNETVEGYTYVPSKDMLYLTYSFRNLKAAEKAEAALKKADKCY